MNEWGWMNGDGFLASLKKTGRLIKQFIYFYKFKDYQKKKLKKLKKLKK